MARDDACFGVPDLRRREQGFLTVNALEGVYHPRVLNSAWMPSWPGASVRLLSCVTIHSGDQEVKALIARRQRTERSRPSRAWLRRPPLHRLRSVRLPEPLDDPQFAIILQPEVEPANHAGRKVIRWTS